MLPVVGLTNASIQRILLSDSCAKSCYNAFAARRVCVYLDVSFFAAVNSGNVVLVLILC